MEGNSIREAKMRRRRGKGAEGKRIRARMYGGGRL